MKWPYVACYFSGILAHVTFPFVAIFLRGIMFGFRLLDRA